MVFFKGKIKTIIGHIIYLWDEGPGGKPFVVYLGVVSAEKNFLKNYLDQIKKFNAFTKEITIEDKNCIDIDTELKRYFNRRSEKMKIDFKFLTGTEFEKKIWTETIKIPYGKTSTYGKLATCINHPGAYRAAGSALGANPIMLIVPCHRVIRSDGSLAGFAGGLGVKRYLLELEKALPLSSA